MPCGKSMKNLQETAKRIRKAVENKEHIVLFGDSDLDGVVSAILLEKTIEKMGGKTAVYLSNRDAWGYGLSRPVVKFIKKEAPALLISLDCGISNIEGVKSAIKAGFEVVIIDHHEIIASLPPASIILNPKQPEDDYPFKKLANAGIAYKLCRVIMKEELDPELLELTVLATIADMVPREEDNKELLEKGLPLLDNPENIALQVLREKIEEQFTEKAVGLLNITKGRGDVNDAFLFLTAKDKESAKKIMERLFKAHEKRKEWVKSSAEETIEKDCPENLFVFEEGTFPAHFAGSIASRVVKKCKKPTFLYRTSGDVYRGSVRMPKGFNAVEAMKHCSLYLEAFGGHPEAAGFTVKKEKLEGFKQCLSAYFNSL